MQFRLLVSGALACFPRPEFSDALVSYDIITPIAALGLIERIHWKPAIRWRIRMIHLLAPVRTIDLVGPRGVMRALEAPCWALDIGFELTLRAGPRDSIDAHESMFLRKARRLDPESGYLGLLELPATLKLVSVHTSLDSAFDGPAQLDLGWLPFERVPKDPRRFRYFRAQAVDGVVTLPRQGEGVFS
ncbi:CRISPR-associated protein Cas5 [Sphingomonas desiccabilis]|uniref:CRISPR-associated protein Cas5 n=1 Tax=Sphingomonas desiccabilis TaxID=429134 RepID=UPI0013EE2713|nr:CRISPR-associated protein Cas5 [Sphingomonas desiccabilis]MBB3909982.1 CRISPR-associated protein Cas5d [Sphingomonas desiccabilis]